MVGGLLAAPDGLDAITARQLAGVDGQVVPQTDEGGIAVNSLDVKRIVAREVVSSVRRTNRLVSRLFGKCDGVRVQVDSLAEGEGEVTYGAAGPFRQLSFRFHYFVVQFFRVMDASEIAMRSRVASDLDARGCHRTQLFFGVGREYLAERRIMRKRLARFDVIDGHEVNAGNLLLNQQRNRGVAIVGVSVIEPNGFSR